MTKKTVRSIVKIDGERCNGCGLCVPSCAEGALKIIDGKACLVSEKYCDGLGACLGECPQGAITIEERPAEEFDEIQVKQHQTIERQEEKKSEICSSATIQEIERPENDNAQHDNQLFKLRYWPVQLTLVPVTAPFLKDADLVLAADCTAFAYSGFHHDFLKDRVLLVACPKLDDFDAHLNKLTQLIAHAQPRSLTVIRMEVPCCSGLVFMAKKALEDTGTILAFKEITIGINGNLKT